MKLLRALLVPVLAVALAATTAYGVGYAVRHDDSATAGTEQPTPVPVAERPAAQPVVDAEPVQARPGARAG